MPIWSLLLLASMYPYSYTLPLGSSDLACIPCMVYRQQTPAQDYINLQEHIFIILHSLLQDCRPMLHDYWLLLQVHDYRPMLHEYRLLLQVYDYCFKVMTTGFCSKPAGLFFMTGTGIIAKGMVLEWL